MLRSKSVCQHLIDLLHKKIILLNNWVSRIIFLLCVLVPLVGYSQSGSVPLTNSNFQTAVNMWFSDEANATATYGHISDWNVSAVTGMFNAFKNRTTFNEDITAWDVSSVISMDSTVSNLSRPPILSI